MAFLMFLWLFSLCFGETVEDKGVWGFVLFCYVLVVQLRFNFDSYHQKLVPVLKMSRLK